MARARLKEKRTQDGRASVASITILKARLHEPQWTRRTSSKQCFQPKDWNPCDHHECWEVLVVMPHARPPNGICRISTGASHIPHRKSRSFCRALPGAWNSRWFLEFGLRSSELLPICVPDSDTRQSAVLLFIKPGPPPENPIFSTQVLDQACASCRGRSRPARETQRKQFVPAAAPPEAIMTRHRGKSCHVLAANRYEAAVAAATAVSGQPHASGVRGLHAAESFSVDYWWLESFFQVLFLSTSQYQHPSLTPKGDTGTGPAALSSYVCMYAAAHLPSFKPTPPLHSLTVLSCEAPLSSRARASTVDYP